MNSLIKPITVLSMVVIFLTVCTTGCTRYLEEETPAAQDFTSPAAMGPAVPRGSIYGMEQTIPGTSQAAPSASTISPYISKPLSGAMRIMTQDTYASSITRFVEAYTKAKSPRIAVYMNRSLSDEVREWMTPVI